MNPYTVTYRLEVHNGRDGLFKIETVAPVGPYAVGDAFKVGNLAEFPDATGDYEIRQVSHFVYATDEHRLVQEIWLNVVSAEPKHQFGFA